MAPRRSIVEFEETLAEEIAAERAVLADMQAAQRVQIVKITTLEAVAAKLARVDDTEGGS